MSLNILFQNECYIAIDKPPGLLVHRSPLDASETVFALQLVRDQVGQSVYPCHRLDKPTSGVLLFALNQDALRHAQNQFAENRCKKIYHAVVRGWTKDSDLIDYDLRSEENPQKSWSAQTAYRTLAQSELPFATGRYNSTRLSLLELIPKTGRKHQLRRHMAHIRHPILGDTRHGDGPMNRFLRKQCDHQSLMLRATELHLSMPDSTTQLKIQTTTPTTFEAAAAKLGFILKRAPADYRS